MIIRWTLPAQRWHAARLAKNANLDAFEVLFTKQQPTGARSHLANYTVASSERLTSFLNVFLL